MSDFGDAFELAEFTAGHFNVDFIDSLFEKCGEKVMVFPFAYGVPFEVTKT